MPLLPTQMEEPTIMPGLQISAAKPLTLLPDDVWIRIAGFASSPRDVYNLCLTSKRFHRPPSIITRNDDNNETQQVVVIATKLLRASLLSSLDYVLHKSKSGITLTDLLKLPFSLLPENSVLITGSIMTQCVLGVSWPGKDIDIFSMPKAAPAVRSWLVKTANQLYAGLNDHYIGIENLGRTMQTSIHHVEKYVKMPEEGYFPEAAQDRIPPGAPFSFGEASRHGETISGFYPRPWQKALYTGTENDLLSRVYEVKTLPDDPFPCQLFDEYHGRPAFDLVVTKAGVSSAKSVLHDFDLTICKCSFDGRKFSIPDPHYTFTGRSKIEPGRKALMTAYRLHYESGNDPHPDWLNLPTPDRMDDEERLERIRAGLINVLGHDPSVQFDEDNELRGEAFLFAQHNFLFKLFDRLKKYQSRGIVFEDAPDLDGFSIRGFNELDMENDIGGYLHGFLR